MAPLIEDSVHGSNRTTSLPRVAIIGAGSRGNAYAQATMSLGLGRVVAVVEPIDFKRQQFGSKFIWGKGKPTPSQAFRQWQDFVHHHGQNAQERSSEVDAVFVCVRDDLHAEVVTALAPLGLHIMCEKPLATSLKDCLDIQRVLQQYPQKVFAIGHVLRYSPHNLLLRDLVLNRKVIGDIVSVEHTEPVGWWHFSHSYVRGHWRKESSSGPSLLTKSCHDIDWLMWMMCSPLSGSKMPPHLPTHVTSTGSLKQFRRSKKPKEAGNSTLR